MDLDRIILCLTIHSYAWKCHLSEKCLDQDLFYNILYCSYHVLASVHRSSDTKMENAIDATTYMFYSSSPMNLSPTVFTYLLFILGAVNWYISYLRLKENDVIQRLF